MKRRFDIREFINNRETPVVTEDGCDVWISKIKNGMVIGSLPESTIARWILKWNLSGVFIHNGDPIEDSKFNLYFKNTTETSTENETVSELDIIESSHKAATNLLIEELKRRLVIMQAYVDGKEIEARNKRCLDGCSCWRVTTKLEWDWDIYDYRVKDNQEESYGVEN